MLGGVVQRTAAHVEGNRFGLAMAVLIDATIIRSVLVPATMKILGEWNWYLPSWLNWLPTLRIEGPSEPDAPAAD